jgi:hypothetical protein
VADSKIRKMHASLKKRLKARRAKEQKIRRHRKFLLESVRTHILPVLIERGFVLAPKTYEGPVDREFVQAFPLGFLRRARPDGRVDLVEIQFASYGGAAFRINACGVPKDGMMTLGGHRTAEKLDAGGLHDHFEMYASPRLWAWGWGWFSLRFWLFRKPVQAEYDELALRVAGFLPEIDLALREDRLGPHMRRVVIPRR